ncbi:hypothetical protein [Bacillus cytotoxicus]|uniref:hypothetical protein n=1 Tax=Bacillus cytotoxicus TaxID=580165 RepID=UPI00244792C7|nr:hypothetical protein [Bacillus cytotoxicus]MDH2880237.1 hypothetical protein [Bacillus cytotoxicus]
MIRKEEEFSKKEEQKQNRLSVFDDDRVVLVISATDGRVTYDSDITHKSYVWSDYGDLQTMTYKELAEIKRRYPRYIDDSWLYIMDDDVREQLGQDEKMFIEPKELERLFSLNTNEMLEEISQYNKGAMEVIWCTARKKCKNGSISDLSKIHALCNRFGWDIEDFIN